MKKFNISQAHKGELKPKDVVYVFEKEFQTIPSFKGVVNYTTERENGATAAILINTTGDYINGKCDKSGYFDGWVCEYDKSRGCWGGDVENGYLVLERRKTLKELVEMM